MLVDPSEELTIVLGPTTKIHVRSRVPLDLMVKKPSGIYEQ